MYRAELTLRLAGCNTVELKKNSHSFRIGIESCLNASDSIMTVLFDRLLNKGNILL